MLVLWHRNTHDCIFAEFQQLPNDATSPVVQCAVVTYFLLNVKNAFVGGKSLQVLDVDLKTVQHFRLCYRIIQSSAVSVANMY